MSTSLKPSDRSSPHKEACCSTVWFSRVLNKMQGNLCSRCYFQNPSLILCTCLNEIHSSRPTSSLISSNNLTLSPANSLHFSPDHGQHPLWPEWLVLALPGMAAAFLCCILGWNGKTLFPSDQERDATVNVTCAPLPSSSPGSPH